MSSTPQEPPGGEKTAQLSHLQRGPDGKTRAQMVDVGSKPETVRTALARARVVFPKGVLSEVLAGQGPKGPIEEVARLAGILGAKRTDELIPLCHSLGLSQVEVEIERLEDGSDVLEIRCRAKTVGRTGVEMEALCGASVAALTVYDMTKGLARGTSITDLELLEKEGGRSGTWRRPEA